MLSWIYWVSDHAGGIITASKKGIATKTERKNWKISMQFSKRMKRLTILDPFSGLQENCSSSALSVLSTTFRRKIVDVESALYSQVLTVLLHLLYSIGRKVGVLY